MKTLTIGEATKNLAVWLQQAIAGEEIGIRSGDAIVALRPLLNSEGLPSGEKLSPIDALRALQQDARLTAAQAEAYLDEVRAERLASEERRTS